MILCVCHGVRCNTVRTVIAKGARSVDAVGAACGAGTDCGSCQGMIEDLIDDALEDECAATGRPSAPAAARVYLPVQSA